MSNSIQNNILKIVNLSIGYTSKMKDILIANDINVNLQQGELVCVLGKNGIGKSTLLRTLTQVQSKLSGKIFLKNKPLENHTPTELAKSISLVLTEKIPPSNLTVYELIALGRQPYTNWLGTLTKEDKKQINFAIEQTHLQNLIHKRCDELSDGQLQRVMICRALAQNTEMIILDEPTAHLDIQHKIETFKLLQNLAHQLQKTILISTHEIQLALQMADKLWLMTSKGLINGEPKTLIENDSINQIFDSKTIYFDKKSNQFLVN
ncbi:MAG: ABC transporter ATP-binding protein [Flavobacteriaceae bacterium]|nr:ABC transporter ATP-binding protein [Flavobacteriaceae bacterium]